MKNWMGLGLWVVFAGCGGGSNAFIPSASVSDDSNADVAVREAEGESDATEGEQLGGFPEALSFEEGCVQGTDCESGKSCGKGEAVGACTLTPSAETALSDPFSQEIAEDAEPDLSCVGTVPDPSASRSVTIYGVVDRFGAGLVTEGIRIRVFDAAGFKPWECDKLEISERGECLNALVESEEYLLGTGVSTAIDEEKGLTCETDTDCPVGYSCSGEGLEDECFVNYGKYEISGVPTNTQLVVMALPENEDDAKDWHNTFMYDVYLLDEFVESEDRYRFDPLIVGHGQWKTVPAPFFTSIEPGNGAIGGRIRDCASTGEGGRKSWNLFEATVGFATPAGKTGYFNDKEEDSLPDPNRTSTNILGRYTGLNVPPGPNVVSAALRLQNSVVNLGATAIYVFPNSLSVVSLPGRAATYTQE